MPIAQMKLLKSARILNHSMETVATLFTKLMKTETVFLRVTNSRLTSGLTGVNEMKITDDGVLIFCFFMLIVLCAGEPDLLDAIIHAVMK